MPGYGFAFHIRVGCKVYLFCVFGFLAYGIQNISPAPEGNVLGLKVLFHIHAKLALGQIPYVTVGRYHLIFTAKKFSYRLCLCGGLDDHQHF